MAVRGMSTVLQLMPVTQQVGVWNAVRWPFVA